MKQSKNVRGKTVRAGIFTFLFCLGGLTGCAGAPARENAAAVQQAAAPPTPVSYAHLPKRGAKDPIFVVLHPPQLDKDLVALERQVPSSTTLAIKMESLIGRDKIIDLTVVSAQQQAPQNPDIEVQLAAHTQQFVGKANFGDPSSLELVLTADIKSRFLEDKVWIEESDMFLQRDRLYKKVAKEILRVIHEEMGIQIPADRSVASESTAAPTPLDLNK